jgi:hypothetical protein
MDYLEEINGCWRQKPTKKVRDVPDYLQMYIIIDNDQGECHSQIGAAQGVGGECHSRKADLKATRKLGVRIFVFFGLRAIFAGDSKR